MKQIKLILSAALVGTTLTACGGTPNTLPPTTYYPNRLLQAQQNAGQIPQQSLGSSVLPNDVTQGQVGSIVGRVVNRSGRPLHNVLISLESDPSINTKSRRGDFTLMNVPAGQHNLIIQLGTVQTQVSVTVHPNVAASPQQNPIQLDGEVGSEALAFANPNRHVASFKVDQDFFNQWQPVGLAVSSGTLYVSAIDVGLVSRKGSIISMDASNGEGWKNVTKKWLGLSYGLNSGTRGMAINGSGTIMVSNDKGGIYNVDPGAGSIAKVEAGGSLDIAAGGGKVYIHSARGLEVTDDSGEGATPTNVKSSGGIAADSEGNGYAPVQNTVQKVAADGTVTTLIKDYLNTPSDIAIDPRNGDIYVLDSGEIKRYDKNGEFVVNFPSGALDAVAITCDEEGNLYVADFGRDQRSAQIIKYEAVAMASDASGAAGIAPAEGVEPGLDAGFEEGGDFEELPAEDEGAFVEEAPGDEGFEELPTFE